MVYFGMCLNVPTYNSIRSESSSKVWYIGLLTSLLATKLYVHVLKTNRTIVKTELLYSFLFLFQPGFSTDSTWGHRVRVCVNTAEDYTSLPVTTSTRSDFTCRSTTCRTRMTTSMSTMTSWTTTTSCPTTTSPIIVVADITVTEHRLRSWRQGDTRRDCRSRRPCPIGSLPTTTETTLIRLPPPEDCYGWSTACRGRSRLRLTTRATR